MGGMQTRESTAQLLNIITQQQHSNSRQQNHAMF
jgi:hypothetical protein